METSVGVRTEQAILAQQVEKNQQLEDLLDTEIELIRRIMLKMSERKTSARKRCSRSSRKMKTETDCESAASGARQHKVWDPGGQRFKTHDLEIMIISVINKGH